MLAEDAKLPCKEVELAAVVVDKAEEIVLCSASRRRQRVLI